MMSTMAHRNNGDGRCIWCHDPWPCFVAQIAHELAEKIRAEIRQLKEDEVLELDKDWAASDAADLIDPEVMSNEHEPTPDGEDGGQNQEVHDEGQQAGHDEPHREED
jgi:hypothetical protein